MNLLLITLDQFRAECLGAAGHPLVKTPNLDRLAAAGVRLTRHYSQAAPCGPGRASLYTGMYQFNHRVVANGTPLDRRFDNIALAARRAGYRPALFGYTDQSVDPRDVSDPADPRLEHYTGVLPGFDPVLAIPDDHQPWLDWLADLGYRGLKAPYEELAREPLRPAAHSVSSFLTDAALQWLDQQDGPWFAHLSYLRPHPPYAAAGEFATMYATADVPAAIEPRSAHEMHDFALGDRRTAAPSDDASIRAIRAQYYGMISEVDAQLGRVWDQLQASGAWEETVIIVTADHGEQLGDHGLLGKLGYFEASFHILGIIRHPDLAHGHGSTLDCFTENIDMFPTICQMLSVPVPAQCDGRSLLALLDGGAHVPTDDAGEWRDAVYWEFDWREQLIRQRPTPSDGWDRELTRHGLAVRRDESTLYVQFSDGTWLCFDLAADPTARTLLSDPQRVLACAQAMLVWRVEHAERTWSDTLIDHGARGRVPPGLTPGVAVSASLAYAPEPRRSVAT